MQRSAIPSTRTDRREMYFLQIFALLLALSTTVVTGCPDASAASIDVVAGGSGSVVYSSTDSQPSDCTWTIQASDDGSVIEAAVVDMYLAPEYCWDRCYCDTMYLDFIDTDDSVIFRTCGNDTSSQIRSSGNVLKIRFVAASTTGHSINVVYEAKKSSEMDPIKECIRGAGKDYFGTKNVSRDGNACLPWQDFADNVANNKTFGTQAEEQVYWPDLNQRRRQNYCRNDLKPGLRPWCYVKTEEQAGYDLYDAKKDCTIPDCGCYGSFNASAGPGTITSPTTGPGYIQHCLWDVRTRSDRAIMLDFVNFDIEELTNQCEYVYVDIMEKAGGEWKRVVRMCGDRALQPYVSSGQEVRISSFSLPRSDRGFTIDYRSVRKPEGSGGLLPWECLADEKGWSYRGTRAVTEAGKACFNWAESRVVHEGEAGDVSFVDGDVSRAKNYCRNPGAERRAPWCEQEEDAEEAFCDIPLCCPRRDFYRAAEPGTVGELVVDEQVDIGGFDCEWLIETDDDDHVIQVDVVEMTYPNVTVLTQTDNLTVTICAFSMLEVWDTDGTKLYTQCGSKPEMNIRSSGPQLRIKSKGPKKIGHDLKFKVNYRAMNPNPGCPLSELNRTAELGRRGEIAFADNFEVKYAECEWFIAAAEDSLLVQIEATELEYPAASEEGERGRRCDHSRLEILDTDGTVIFRTCGSEPFKIRSTGPLLRVRSLGPVHSQPTNLKLTLKYLAVQGITPAEECRTGSGYDYFGVTAVTKDSSTCLPWNDFTLNAINKTLFEEYEKSYWPELDQTNRENYCRNDIKRRPGGPWCYTIEESTTNPEAFWKNRITHGWEYCAIPRCECSETITVSHTKAYLPITSENYPISYPETYCQWTLLTESTDMTIELNFLDLDVHSTVSSCTRDYVDIYDMSTGEPKLVHKLCGYMVLPVYTGRNMMISFTSQGVRDDRRGFRISYSAKQRSAETVYGFAISDCKLDKVGWAYLGSQNRTTSGAECQPWVNFYPETSTSDGPNTDFPDGSPELAGSYCRNPYKRSDGPFCHVGEMGNIEQCDVPLCTKCPLSGDQLVFEAYLPITKTIAFTTQRLSTHCQWTIQTANRDHVIELDLNGPSQTVTRDRFGQPGPDVCDQDDQVVVKDTDGSTLIRACGTEPVMNIRSSGNKLTLDVYKLGSGEDLNSISNLELKYTAIMPDGIDGCQYMKKTHAGNNHGNYKTGSDKASCKARCDADDGCVGSTLDRSSVCWMHFRLDESGYRDDCDDCVLYIKDCDTQPAECRRGHGFDYLGSRSSTASQHACLPWKDKGVNVTGNACRNDVERRSTGPWCYVGDSWETCAIPECECTATIAVGNSETLEIATPGNPDAAYPAKTCAINFKAEAGRVVQLNITVALKGDSLDCSHHLSIREFDVNQEKEVISARLCGVSVLTPFVSMGNEVTVTLVAPEASDDPALNGFSISYRSLPAPPAATEPFVTGFSKLGCIKDEVGWSYTGFKRNTRSNLPCLPWKDQVSPYDDDAIYPDRSREDAENYCRNPDQHHEGPYCMVDSQLLMKGFDSCNVHSCDCEEIIFTSVDASGTIRSPNFPQAYPTNHICSWTIVMDGAGAVPDMIELDFKTVALNPGEVAPQPVCRYYIDIFEPDMTHPGEMPGNLLQRICSNHVLPPYTTMWPAITIELVGAELLLATGAEAPEHVGFEIEYKAKNPGDITMPERMAASGFKREECIRDDVGWGYRGTQNKSATGKACTSWSGPQTAIPFGVTALMFPDASMQTVGVSCRNPFRTPGGPICFTDSGTFEPCGVKKCDESDTTTGAGLSRATSAIVTSLVILTAALLL